MIVLGVKGKVLKDTEEVVKDCPHCGTKKHLVISAIRYFHVCWIPFFIYNREMAVVCPGCKNKYEYWKLPAEEIKGIKSKAFRFGKVCSYYTFLWILLALGLYVLTKLN